MFEPVPVSDRTKRYWEEVSKRAAVKKRLKNNIKSVTWMNSRNPVKKEKIDWKKWWKLKTKAKERDKCCVECEGEIDLHVHHILPIHSRPELKYSLSNLRTLCKTCHERLHKDYWIVKYEDIV